MPRSRRRLAAAACQGLMLTLALAGPPARAETAATAEAVAQTYVQIAAATYGDALLSAQALDRAVEALIAAPSEETLAAARAAWRAARPAYQQSETFRFANPIVDDWEGRVNSWPLDEGLIDYVARGTAENEENDHAGLNVIANPRFTLSGKEIDAAAITPELIAGTLHEADGIEANVASGYHAIEFLLWGQDLNGTGPGAGNRPFTDYVQGAGCTGGNCDRRAQYLQAATDLLVADLAFMAGEWADGGAARAAVLADPQGVALRVLTSIGSLSYGELAGERMRLGLMLNDPEEEQDCFSDTTPWSHYNDGLGMQNLYLGRYVRLDGTVVAGPSVSALVAAADPAADAGIRGALEATVAALKEIVAAAEGGMAYDMMLAPGNATGETLIMAGVDALVAQTTAVERGVAALGAGGVAFEGSDSLDNPSAVFQ